jgi:hypothetical protein
MREYRLGWTGHEEQKKSSQESARVGRRTLGNQGLLLKFKIAESTTLIAPMSVLYVYHSWQVSWRSIRFDKVRHTSMRNHTLPCTPKFLYNPFTITSPLEVPNHKPTTHSYSVSHDCLRSYRVIKQVNQLLYSSPHRRQGKED